MFLVIFKRPLSRTFFIYNNRCGRTSCITTSCIAVSLPQKSGPFSRAPPFGSNHPQPQSHGTPAPHQHFMRTINHSFSGLSFCRKKIQISCFYKLKKLRNRLKRSFDKLGFKRCRQRCTGLWRHFPLHSTEIFQKKIWVRIYYCWGVLGTVPATIIGSGWKKGLIVHAS